MCIRDRQQTAAPGPIAATSGPAPPTSRSARTPSSSTPAARPRQPACTIATAPSPARATGRQSAVSTIAPTPRTQVACPSASIATASPPLPWTARTRWTVVPCTWRLAHSQSVASSSHSRSRAERPRSCRSPRCVDRLPCAREVNSARAPPGSSHEKPSACSTTRACAVLTIAPAPCSQILQRGAQLGLASLVELAVELARERARQAPADLRSRGDAGGEQVVAVDRQAHVAQLGQPAAREVARVAASLGFGQRSGERNRLERRVVRGLIDLRRRLRVSQALGDARREDRAVHRALALGRGNLKAVEQHAQSRLVVGGVVGVAGRAAARV